MSLYKIKIKLHSSYITPWESDTIFGMFCWSLLETQGEQKLKLFLNEYDNNKYPIVFSNGFIDDYLPKPFILDIEKSKSNLKSESIKERIEYKKNKAKTLITLSDFNKFINGETLDSLEQINNINQTIQVVTHTQIDRNSLKAQDGALYQTTEIFQNNNITIYANVDEIWYDTFEYTLNIMQLNGYGKSASKGKGHYSIESISKWNELNIPQNPNSYIILSNYVPKQNESINGIYKTFTKYPKLGNQYAIEGSPFKKPVLFIKSGSIFFETASKFSYGRIVKNVSSTYKDVVQCGCALAIPSIIN